MISIATPSIRLLDGRALTRVGTITLNSNTTQTITTDLLWSSSNEDFVSVTQNGVATAIAAGEASVTVLQNETGLEAFSVVTVAAPVVGVSSYTVGGTTSGLTGNLVLQVNGVDDLTQIADGDFTFDTSIVDGDDYAVTVLTQPIEQTCVVSNGSGTVATAVTNVTVVCTTNTYTIGGTITGLVGTLELYDNNLDESLSVSADGTYTADVTNMNVVCTTNTFTVGGTISGLSGTAVLQNSGGNDLSIATNGSFTFSNVHYYGSTYAVTVLTPPSGQICVVLNGSGTVTYASITNISIVCGAPYTVGGTVTIPDGSAYVVSVSSHPLGQICTITNGSGTVSGGAVTNVTVTCATAMALFPTSTAGAGSAIASRANIDSICSASVAASRLNCNSVRAFISITGTDEIRDMPANYSVPTNVIIKGANGATIATDWADLLDGSIQTNLATATGSPFHNGAFWWSGSTSAGALGSTCGSWNTGGQNATLGRSGSTDGNWIGSFVSTCSQNFVKLCVCY